MQQSNDHSIFLNVRDQQFSSLGDHQIKLISFIFKKNSLWITPPPPPPWPFEQVSREMKPKNLYLQKIFQDQETLLQSWFLSQGKEWARQRSMFCMSSGLLFQILLNSGNRLTVHLDFSIVKSFYFFQSFYSQFSGKFF